MKRAMFNQYRKNTMDADPAQYGKNTMDTDQMIKERSITTGKYSNSDDQYLTRLLNLSEVETKASSSKQLGLSPSQLPRSPFQPSY
jgi:hypothetical protein